MQWFSTAKQKSVVFHAHMYTVALGAAHTAGGCRWCQRGSRARAPVLQEPRTWHRADRRMKNNSSDVDPTETSDQTSTGILSSVRFVVNQQ
jgi:hypothetical protein